MNVLPTSFIWPVNQQTSVFFCKVSCVYVCFRFSVCHLPGEVFRVAEGQQRELQQRRHRESPHKKLHRRQRQRKPLCEWTELRRETTSFHLLTSWCQICGRFCTSANTKIHQCGFTSNIVRNAPHGHVFRFSLYSSWCLKTLKLGSETIKRFYLKQDRNGYLIVK